MKRKKKKCKICKTEFYPHTSLQVVCSVKCSIEYTNTKIKQDAVKKARKRRKEGLEELMTKSDWKKKLQATFNTYIRLRDINKGCVSCETSLLNRKYDAGHFYPTTYEGLRFDERNVHGQCVPCNRNLHGNLHEYKKRITNRISKEDLKWLDNNRHKRLDMNITDIKEMLVFYKNKIKEIKKHG